MAQVEHHSIFLEKEIKVYVCISMKKVVELFFWVAKWIMSIKSDFSEKVSRNGYHGPCKIVEYTALKEYIFLQGYP